jgi:hypothetical protein
MSTKTYEVFGVGSHGIASPYHNPACDAKLYVNGKFFASLRESDSYSAHYAALSRGFSPDREDMKTGTVYRLAALDLGLIEI